MNRTPRIHNRQHGGRHDELGAHLPPVAGPQMLHGVEGHRLVLDFLGPVPAQHVQHHRIGADLVVGRRVEDPLPQDCGVVLDRGDDRNLLEQPALLAAFAPVGPGAQQLVEQPLDLAGVGGQVDVARGEVGEHVGVRLRMHGLLADEALDVEPQLVVLDQWQRLLEDLDEELLAGGQQQVQHVEDVRRERLTGHVVERQLRPVEVDIARLEHQSLVVQRGVVRTRCLVVDGQHHAPYLGVLPSITMLRWTSRVPSIGKRPRYAKPPVPGSRVIVLSPRWRAGAARTAPGRGSPASGGGRPA